MNIDAIEERLDGWDELRSNMTRWLKRITGLAQELHDDLTNDEWRKIRRRFYLFSCQARDAEATGRDLVSFLRVEKAKPETVLLGNDFSAILSQAIAEIAYVADWYAELAKITRATAVGIGDEFERACDEFDRAVEPNAALAAWTATPTDT